MCHLANSQTDRLIQTTYHAIQAEASSRGSLSVCCALDQGHDVYTCQFPRVPARHRHADGDCAHNACNVQHIMGKERATRRILLLLMPRLPLVRQTRDAASLPLSLLNCAQQKPAEPPVSQGTV